MAARKKTHLKFVTELAEPPAPKARPNSKYNEVVNFVRSKKGKWCKVTEQDKNSPSARGGTLCHFKRKFPDCEWVSRVVGNNTCIFGRLIEAPPPAAEVLAQNDNYQLVEVPFDLSS